MAIVVEHDKRKHEILEKSLDVFIEEGIYGGHGYVKRPAYERSMERIESENVVEEAMENQLKKAGWEFE